MLNVICSLIVFSKPGPGIARWWNLQLHGEPFVVLVSNKTIAFTRWKARVGRIQARVVFVSFQEEEGFIISRTTCLPASKTINLTNNVNKNL